MKKLFYLPLLMFVLAFACKEKHQRPSVLYISGSVKDTQTNAPLDSVEVSLLSKKSGDFLAFSHVELTIYADSVGNFNFQFSPADNYLYAIDFRRNGYCHSGCHSISIDRDKEYQYFNVSLEH